MPTPATAPERRIDRTVVLACVVTLAALYLFLFRVLEGSWINMVHDIGGVIAPIAVYLALVASILIPAARRGGDVKRWWVLLLLPVCGAIAGIVAHGLGAGGGTLRQAMVAGAGYGVMHALFLGWSWRRQARRQAGGLLDIRS